MEAAAAAAAAGSMLPQTPMRVQAPTEGRNSITYPPLAPLQDTTNIFMIDNKSADIESLNLQNDHSNFFTNVIHNADLPASDASHQSIQLDPRSRWVGGLHTLVKSVAPNVTEYNSSNTLRVRLMTKKKTVPATPPAAEGASSENSSGSSSSSTPATTTTAPVASSSTASEPETVYEWVTLTLPEGNYILNEIIDLLNAQIFDHYLANGRQHNVLVSDIGVKFDTRLMNLGKDPVTGLVTPGTYTYKSFHPDIFLLPGCAVDFTASRISNFLGIRKRHPYEPGFIIDYDMLAKGNIPALLKVDDLPGKRFTESVPKESCKPITHDADGISYNLITDPENPTCQCTQYRSWALSYHAGGPARDYTLLTVPDITGGVGQLYWSLPDAFKPPVTFANNRRETASLPVVGCQLFPMSAKVVYNTSAVYSQLVEQSTNTTLVFNRFPHNQILIQPPISTVTWVSDNVPSVADHGEQPLRNSISGVQRVTLTDDRRRTCPYIVKSLARIQPRVASSATLL